VSCAIACAWPSAKRAPAVHPRLETLECVTGWFASETPSPQASWPLYEGGYRVHAGSASSELGHPSNFIVLQTFEALGAAVRDHMAELRRCMTDADAVDPDLQYVVRIELDGGQAAGMTVSHVTAQRLAGLRPDGVPLLVPTRADACFSRTLEALEVPPGLGPATMELDLRYIDCIPPRSGRR
jgi:hypothetical protein